MKLDGNTVFITGGGSGIGRGLAEAFHKRGSKVIIGGRRPEQLQSTLDANPGMTAVQLDISDPASIRGAATKLVTEHPALNILFNNAGAALMDDAASELADSALVKVVETNLLGSIRMTSALINHLKTRDNAVVAYTTSTLGFVPHAMAAVYSATKAALHSYVLSQRFMLKGSGVAVVEIAPPWVRTGFMNNEDAEQAMPLEDFLAEALDLLATEADEIIVSNARAFRDNVGPNEQILVDQFNEQIKATIRGEPQTAH